MDSHLFRLMANELAPALSGRRIQKIYGPAPDVFSLDLGAGPGGRFLLMRSGNKDPLLFLAPEKPRNPDTPEAHVMWLRKHLQGRRLREQHCDWPKRRLAWELSGLEKQYLLLCLRKGLSIVDVLPDNFGHEPQWPDLDTVLQAIAQPDDERMEETIWRLYPHISPALRKTLAALPLNGAQELYSCLQRGEARQFFVYCQDAQGQCLAEPLSWRLPAALQQGREERIFASAHEAAAYAGAVTLFSQLSRLDDAAQRSAHKKAHKRIKRALAKLAQEERRLRGMISLREKGLALQGALWQLQPNSRLHTVSVTDHTQREHNIDLDPSQTIAENMARFFRLAAKGERGLPLNAARRQALELELDALRRGTLPQREQRRAESMEEIPSSKKRAKSNELAVQRFKTSDGFLLLRGRNKAANHKLLGQAASSYDLWFHAQDGPGAHLILKRDHPKQEPPRTSLLEAAALAGLKGWQAQDGKARVICALVKDVRKRKGADLGSVAVDKILEAFLVPLDPELEKRLRIG